MIYFLTALHLQVLTAVPKKAEHPQENLNGQEVIWAYKICWWHVTHTIFPCNVYIPPLKIHHFLPFAENQKVSSPLPMMCDFAVLLKHNSTWQWLTEKYLQGQLPNVRVRKHNYYTCFSLRSAVVEWLRVCVCLCTVYTQKNLYIQLFTKFSYNKPDRANKIKESRLSGMTRIALGLTILDNVWNQTTTLNEECVSVSFYLFCWHCESATQINKI